MTPLVTASVLVKSLALVVFLGAIGGAAYGVQVVTGDPLEGVTVSATPARSQLNATPGHDVTFAVTLTNRGETALDVGLAASGEGVAGALEPVVVPAASSRTVFFTLQVAADAAVGEHALDLRLVDGAGDVVKTAQGALRVKVLGEGLGFAQGDTARVVYVGRIASTGRVFNTNDPALQGLDFPKTESYSFSEGLLPVQTVPEPSVVPGFYEGLLGMRPGESRTVTFPAEKGYGDALDRQELARFEPIERTFDLPLRSDGVARATFDDYIRQTDQGDPADYQPGDTFHFIQEPNRWPYKIESIDAQNVRYSLDAQVGQRFALYPFWPEGSEVVARNETHVAFFTTPTTATGENFSMVPQWPEMSRVHEVTEDEIVVEHAPPVGFKYTQPGNQFTPDRDFTVAELTEESIVVTTPSGNPLAGRALTFDIQLVELTR